MSISMSLKILDFDLLRSPLFLLFLTLLDCGSTFSLEGIASITEDAVIAPSFGITTVVVVTILSELFKSATLCKVLRRFFDEYSPLGLCSLINSRFLLTCKSALISRSSSDLETQLRSLSMEPVESSSGIAFNL